MWMLLGIGAIVFAVLTVICVVRDKGAKWFSYISLSLTALTLCAFYSDGATRVANGDLAGLMDIMPVMSKILWVCTVVSILVNFTAFIKTKNKRFG